jgi:hypothetical protein
MGTWGPGVFENDHACDLFEIEVARLKTTQGMWVASGTALASPGNGPDGLPQYFIPGVKNDPGGYRGRLIPAIRGLRGWRRSHSDHDRHQDRYRPPRRR